MTLTAFEKYLTGEPLNEELAALRRGEIPEVGAATHPKPTTVVDSKDEDRPLIRAERQALREAREVGAVTTLSRLLRSIIRRKIQTATIDSETDPLGRQAEIAQTWAYVVAFRTACVEIEFQIQAEIDALEREERGQ